MSLKLLKFTSVVGSMTLLSRISGLVRDIVFANILGDKAAADVFFVAFKIPNFFRRIFGEGAFTSAFIPVFTQYRTHHTPQQTEQFLALMSGRLGLLLLAFSALGVVFAPLLVSVIAAGFHHDAAKYELAVWATRVMFPYIFFISLVAMAAAMLNTCGRFAAPAATPILLNLCLIAAALAPLTYPPPIALGIGVLVAGALQLLFQLPWLKQEGLSIRPKVRTTPDNRVGAEGVGRVFKLVAPAILGVSVAQINTIVNTMLATFLITGSVSWLYYSDRLMEFPVGVFGIALGTAILPQLSRRYAEDAAADFAGILDWGLRWVALICIPCTAGLMILAVPLVATIFYHGDFTANGVAMTAWSLIAYTIGLTAIVMVKVLAPGFYARQNTQTPVRVAMVALALNIVFCLALIYPLKHIGLALATSLSSIVNAAVLFVLLKRQQVFQAQAGWGRFLVRVLFGAAVMSGVLAVFRGDSAFWLEATVWDRIWRLGGLLLGGGTSYVVALLVVGMRPRMLWFPDKETLNKSS